MIPEEREILNEIHRALSGNKFAGTPGLIENVRRLEEKFNMLEDKLENRERKNKYIIQGISAGLGVAGLASAKAIYEIISKLLGSL